MKAYITSRESRTLSGYWCAWGGLKPLLGTSPVDERQKPVYFNYDVSSELAFKAVENQLRDKHGCTEFVRQ